MCIRDSASPNPLTTISAIDPIRVDFSVSEQDFLNSMDSHLAKEKHLKFDVILANGTEFPMQGLSLIHIFSMPSSNNKMVLVEINREEVSHLYSYRRLVAWCEMERSFNLTSQLWELSFVRSGGEEFVEAYNRNTMPPHRCV